MKKAELKKCLIFALSLIMTAGISVPALNGGGITLNGITVPLASDAGLPAVNPGGERLREILGAARGGEIIFDLSGVPDAAGIVLVADPGTLCSAGEAVTLRFGDYSVKLPLEMLAALDERYEGDLAFSIRKDGIKTAVTKDGEDVGWYDTRNPMTVGIPYALPSEASPESIVMTVDRGENDSAHIIPRSWYRDWRVFAKVYRTGSYDGRNLTWGIFRDTQGNWMNAAASYLSARGVVQGVTNPSYDPSIGTMTALFAPDRTITRAEFLTILMRALDPEPRGEWGARQYKDIPPDAYYRDDALRGKVLGIIPEDSENKFYPDEPIIRQDMFTMLYNMMECGGMLPEMMATQFVPFDDWDQISEYAREPIRALSKLGIANGYNGKISPRGSATRAEAAQVIYNVLKRDAD